MRVADAVFSVPNWFYRRAMDWPGRAVFHDIDQVCPELRILERNYPSIKAEFDRLKRHLSVIPAYHEVDRHQQRIAQSPVGGSNWRVFFFEAMGRKIRLNRKLCPDTAALIDRIPKVFQACFSILEPRKSVPAHCGLYNGYLRYHLGIEVPRDLTAFHSHQGPGLHLAGGRRRSLRRYLGARDQEQQSGSPGGSDRRYPTADDRHRLAGQPRHGLARALHLCPGCLQ